MFSAPNYTQTPNDFFDQVLPTLKEAEMKVLLVVMRQTFGWQKRWDCISLTQMEKKTGLSRPAITAAVKSLTTKKLILTHKKGPLGNEQTYYTLAVTESPHDPTDEDEFSNNSYPLKSLTPPSKKSLPTKETTTKEKKRHPTGVKSARVPRAPHVSSSQEEHEKLVKEFGEEKVQRAYQRLSEWKEDTPKSKWKLNDHLAIRRWVFLALEEEELRNKILHQPRQNAIDLVNKCKEKNLSFFRRGEIEILGNGVAFKKGNFYREISFQDKNFENMFRSQIAKMGGKL